MSLTVRWRFSITGNCVISRNPSRSGFDLSSLEDETAEKVVRVAGIPRGHWAYHGELLILPANRAMRAKEERHIAPNHAPLRTDSSRTGVRNRNRLSSTNVPDNGS